MLEWLSAAWVLAKFAERLAQASLQPAWGGVIKALLNDYFGICYVRVYSSPKLRALDDQWQIVLGLSYRQDLIVGLITRR